MLATYQGHIVGGIAEVPLGVSTLQGLGIPPSVNANPGLNIHSIPVVTPPVANVLSMGAYEPLINPNLSNPCSIGEIMP